jgi:hypothetical protein
LNTTITFSGSSPCARRRSISSASSFFLTFTLRPTDHRISISTKSALREVATSG